MPSYPRISHRIVAFPYKRCGVRYVSFFAGDDTNRRIGILYRKFLTTMVVVSEARYMNKLNVMYTL